MRRRAPHAHAAAAHRPRRDRADPGRSRSRQEPSRRLHPRAGVRTDRRPDTRPRRSRRAEAVLRNDPGARARGPAACLSRPLRWRAVRSDVRDGIRGAVRRDAEPRSLCYDPLRTTSTATSGVQDACRLGGSRALFAEAGALLRCAPTIEAS
jgi:hypothetical protein